MTKDGEAKCPFSGGSQHTVATRSNKLWCPNQLNLIILHQHDTKSNPMGEGFDYREEFKKIDYDAVSYTHLRAHEPRQAGVAASG